MALVRTDAAIQALLDAAGGVDEFLERYAVILHSDHGQTTVGRAAQLEVPLAAHADSIVVTASNRAGQVYLLPDARVDATALARALDAEPSVETTLRLEGNEAVARRAREELRFRPEADGWETSGDRSILDHPDALHRSWSALANPNAGELLVSAAAGLGVRRPRRQAPRRRRESRVARRGRLDRAVAHGRRRCGDRPHHRRDARGARALRTRTRWLTVEQWSSASFARAASTTSACSRRWDAFRASCSCRTSCGRSAYDDAALADRRANRRSRSRTWSRASARSCTCTATRRCSTSAPARATRRRCSPSLRAKCIRSSGFRRLRTGRAQRSPRPATPTASTFTTRTAPSACRPRRRFRASPSPPPPGARRPLCSSSSTLGGRLVIPIGPQHQQFLTVFVQTPEGLADPCRRPVPVRAPRHGRLTFAERPPG